ncbi:ArsR/SmtB family transcription factor [Kitasatospora sp. NPDC001309]|uniref:ArsR/SmtB family transcription factor n=1 Tax=Kitasatospora sp. NPDC001309 TaxID=3364013 RepID=UPI003683B2B0
MLEIGFRPADLARVRFAVSPLDHVLGGVAGPQHHCARDSVNRDRWWRRVKGHVPQQAAAFIDLVNASPLGVPMFLTPDSTAARATIGDELDALLALPEAEVHREMQDYGTGPDLPRVIAELRDGGTRRLRRITDAAWALFRTCLAPDWPDIQRALRADVEQRSRAVAETGLGPMLAQLHPDLSWHDEGTLRYASPEWRLAYDLGGRGLELRPNLFLSGLTAPLGAHRSPALLYPGRDHPARHADGLARLLGTARTRALRAIAQGACTTGQLAEDLGVSAPTASAHATVLRDAGVITTERRGREVRHSLTALGRDLLLG